MTTFKEFKKNYNKQTKGLGDTIKKITKATGIDKVVEFIAGEDCGCDERQKKLNTKFRYDIPDCLNEEEYNYLKTELSQYQTRPITADEQRALLKIYNRIFKRKKSFTTCSSCIKGLYNELNTVLKSYDKT
tara:strand:+ start:5258 stop:5650 length:393 start_codon:yes stop_codon:yes gene_type:complete